MAQFCYFGVIRELLEGVKQKRVVDKALILTRSLEISGIVIITKCVTRDSIRLKKNKVFQI